MMTLVALLASTRGPPVRTIYGRLAVFLTLSCSCLVVGCRRGATEHVRPADRNVLTQAQLADHRFTTAYDAVEALRSNWLNTRGSDSFQTPSYVRVYLDNVSLGGTETLRSIAVGSINYIKYFDGITATSRWGVNHGAGVIYVSTRPAGAADPHP